MTDRELMQQALDYYDEFKHLEGFTYAFGVPMEEIRARLEQNDFNPDWDAMAVMVEEQQRMAKRIEELKERLLQVELNSSLARLAQPEPPCKTGSQCVGGKCERCAEPEPVAYICNTEYGTSLRKSISDDVASFEHGGKKAWKPLYTAPPRKEWQGLMDEDLINCETEFDVAFARAIEAKLKEKNA